MSLHKITATLRTRSLKKKKAAIELQFLHKVLPSCKDTSLLKEQRNGKIPLEIRMTAKQTRPGDLESPGTWTCPELIKARHV